jgi:hypothetical protein
MKDSELKSLFGSYSQQRSKFASELQNEAVSVIILCRDGDLLD